MLAATDDAGIKKLQAFRGDLIAATKIVPKFNKSLEVMRDFRGEEFAAGVEKIQLRKPGAGRKASEASEEDKLKDIFG